MRTFRLRTLFDEQFWNIDCQGPSLIREWGEVGTRGRRDTLELPSSEEARAECERLVAEKLAEGYKETTVTPRPAPAVVPPLQKALEEAIVADPDDLAAHQAYADWLTEQGDPRGEFIRVQLALEELPPDSEQASALSRRAADLLAEHESTWVGELAPALRGFLTETEPRFRFVRGWLDHLRQPFLTRANARLLAASPRLRMVRNLTIQEAEGSWDEPEDEEEDENESEVEGGFALDFLLSSRYLRNVQCLRLLDFVFMAEWLRGTLHPFTLPRLEHLAVGYSHPQAASGEWLCEQLLRCPELTRLRQLELWNVVPARGSVGRLLNSPVLLNLEVLDWRGPPMPQDLQDQLCEKGIRLTGWGVDGARAAGP